VLLVYSGRKALVDMVIAAVSPMILLLLGLDSVAVGMETAAVEGIRRSEVAVLLRLVEEVLTPGW
jgi:hypothetical protein